MLTLESLNRALTTQLPMTRVKGVSCQQLGVNRDSYLIAYSYNEPGNGETSTCYLRYLAEGDLRSTSKLAAIDFG